MTTTIYITTPNERPDFRLVIAFLWRDGQNVDTEGDSHHPASRTWTELYVQNREHKDEVVEVSQYQLPLVLRIESEQQHLAARVAFFLATYCNGGVSSEPDGEFHMLLTRRSTIPIRTLTEKICSKRKRPWGCSRVAV